MELMAIIPQSRVAAMTRAGFWGSATLLDFFDEAVARRPHRLAIVDGNSETGQATTLTYGELDGRVRRIAARLLAAGVQKGDVVSFQLPNWWHFTAMHLACLRVGAITNPLMPIFRERELKFMLGFAESKVMVVPKSFRGFDHQEMMAGLAGSLPHLRLAAVVGSGDERDFDRLMLDPALASVEGLDAIFAARRPIADEVVQLMYTSGTTGEPKGVMHTSNTLFANILPLAKRLEMAAEDVILCPTPNAHQLGFLYGVLMPIVLGCKVVLQDIWHAQTAASLIQRHKATLAMGATPFLADLATLPSLSEFDLSTLRLFLSAGAPIPRALVQNATERLGATVISAWGMTENGAVTNTRPSDPPEKVFNTDGLALPGMEVRVVDFEGRRLPAGEEGALQARGASNFVGYLKRPDLYATSDDGWFDTGDLARLDGDGYLRISGRAKDIIIRGGENIPVVEVENLLFRHPAVAEVSIVAMPDERLGERACAFVVLKPDTRLELKDMAEFLAEQKMAKQYHPERLEVIEAMPRTPSGKIQKFRLREMARQMAVG